MSRRLSSSFEFESSGEFFQWEVGLAPVSMVRPEAKTNSDAVREQ